MFPDAASCKAGNSASAFPKKISEAKLGKWKMRIKEKKRQSVVDDDGRRRGEVKPPRVSPERVGKKMVEKKPAK